MIKREGFWKAHGIELALLALVIFLTGLLIHMNSRLSKVYTSMNDNIARVDRSMADLEANVEEQLRLLDRDLLSPGRQVLSKHEEKFPRVKALPGPDQSLDFRTVADPEIESLALNWGLLRRAFPRRLQDSKEAYLNLINQLGFPVTEQQRMQMRKVVHETFGLVECITLSAGWEK